MLSYLDPIDQVSVDQLRTRLLRETDLAATRLNAIVAGHVSGAMCPLDYETDREILNLALGTVGLVEPANARRMTVVRCA